MVMMTVPVSAHTHVQADHAHAGKDRKEQQQDHGTEDRTGSFYQQKFGHKERGGRRAADQEDPCEPEYGVAGEFSEDPAHFRHGAGAVGKENIARQQEERHLDDTVSAHVDERVRFRTQSPEDRGKPHMFHAGIGKHAFEVALPDDEEGGDQQRDHPQRDQQIVRKILETSRCHVQYTDDPEEGAVQQCAGKQRRDGAGCFTVGVRQPGMEGSQPHFCAVARKHEDECGFEPGGVQVFRSVPDRFHIQSVNIRIRSRHGHGDGAEKGEGDPHGADQQILPHGFQ